MIVGVGRQAGGLRCGGRCTRPATRRRDLFHSSPTWGRQFSRRTPPHPPGERRSLRRPLTAPQGVDDSTVVTAAPIRSPAGTTRLVGIVALSVTSDSTRGVTAPPCLPTSTARVASASETAERSPVGSRTAAAASAGAISSEYGEPGEGIFPPPVLAVRWSHHGGEPSDYPSRLIQFARAARRGHVFPTSRTRFHIPIPMPQRGGG